MTNIFDNAKTVMFNNKEVKSITTSNSGVIWEKGSIYYDNCSINKSSNYVVTNLNGNITPSLSYISNEQCYQFLINGINNYHGYSPLLLNITSNNCIISFKAKAGKYNGYCYYGDMGLGKWNINNNIAGMHYIRTGNFSPNTVRYSESNSSGNTHKISNSASQNWAQDTYYYIELKITNGVNAEFKVYNESKTTLLYSHTTTMHNSIRNGQLCIVTPWQTSYMKFKEIKVKLL